MNALFEDPNTAKAMVMVLGGIVIILAIALIIVGIRKNTYYVKPETAPAAKPAEKPRETKQAKAPAEKPKPVNLDQTIVSRPIHENMAIKETVTPVETREVPLSVKTPQPKALIIKVRIGSQTDEYNVHNFPCMIGRESSECDLVLNEPAVSRRHAKFIRENDELKIEDVSEHNGTYVNGVKLPSLGSAKLSVGDEISMGRALITVENIEY